MGCVKSLFELIWSIRSKDMTFFLETVFQILNVLNVLNVLNICDVPQEKGASRKIPKLFWDTCGKVAGKLWESCGKSCRDLRESCGKFDRSLREKVVGSCGKLRDSGNQNLQDEIVLADCKRSFVFYVWFCFVFVTKM